MKRYIIPYLISEGFKNVRKNKVLSAASVFVLVSCMIVTGTFLIFFNIVNENFSSAEKLYVLTAYVSADADESVVLDAVSKVEILDNVKSVSYVSKEEALQSMKDDSLVLSSVIEEYKGELSDVIRPRLDIIFESYDSITSLIYEVEEIDGIESVVSKTEMYQSVSNIKKVLSVVGVCFSVLLFAVSVFVVLSAVRMAIYARQAEISVMRYIGATKNFVATPFIVECFIVGVFSAFVALAIEWLLYDFVIRDFVLGYGIAAASSFIDYFAISFLAFIVIGVLNTVLSGAVCLKKYLNV